MSQRLLIVDVLGARNLIACERSGTSDPYVVANLLDIANREIKNEKHKTSAKTKTLNPKWDHRLTLGQNYDLNNTSALPTLSLKMFHKASTTFGTDAPMGSVEVPLSSIKPDGSPTDQWYPLQKMGRMKDVAGEIHIIARFSGPPAGEEGMAAAAGGASFDLAVDPAFEVNPDHEDAEPNELHILCIQGKDLPIMDKAVFGKGSSDPLIKAKIKGMKTQQTKHINKTLEPVWNETLIMKNVFDPSLSLEIVCEDHDTLSNDFMGKVIIPLFSFEDKAPQRKWYKLLDSHGNADGVNRGEVELNICWRFNPDLADNKKKGGGLLAKLGGGDSDSEIDEEDGEEPADAVPVDPEEAERLKKEKEEAEDALKKELGDIEIKSGDYQIQVNILEARELKGKDMNGLSDPIVYIHAFGEKQNSSVQRASLNCVFDELFIFNFRNLDKDEFSEGVIRVEVMNANVVTKNDLIGAYTFDASQVYYQKDHEMYRKWVALMNDDDPEDNAVQGYLKLSVQVVGPGDKLKVHDEEEEMRKEREAMAKGGTDIGSMVIMPPTIKKEWKYIVTSVYRAEYLPVMDQQAVQIGGLLQNGTDAYVQVQFAGGKPQKTKVKTLKGERNAMNPIFNYEIWYPVSCPSATQTIKTSVWDHDVTGSDIIASFYDKFNFIEKLPQQRTGVKWVNMYGAPVSAGFSLKSTVKGGITKLKNIADINYTDVYNTYPDRAPVFKGRMLISQRIESERPKKYDTDEIEPFRRSIKRLPQKAEPPTRRYTLKALVVSGTELPQFVDAKNPLKKQKLQVQISIGRYELFTQRAECVKGVSEWNEFLTQDFDYPVDVSMIPDVCVYLCVGKGSDLQPVCFYRMKAKDLITEEFKSPPKWIFMKEDKSIDALDDGQFPGSVLIRLGLGTEEHAADSKQEWDESIQRMKRRSPYQVRCHLYQGSDFPAADSNGLLDPFFKINLLGQVKESDRKKKTRFPLYYQTLTFDCELPEREFLPQVNLQLFDADMLMQVEYMSQMFFNLKDAYILDNLDDPLPDPEYHDLFIEQPGDGQGKVLVAFQLILKTRPDMVFPKPEPIIPSLRPAFIEIIALGIRSMKPYKFQDMVCPFLEMELECVDKKVMIETEASKRPAPSDPNFLQRLIMPVMLPDNALFATPMALRARDTRLGGYMKPEVGVSTVDLVDKIPWSKTYKPPQSDIFFQDSLNMAAGFSAGSEEEAKDSGPVLDAAAKAAIELQEKRTAQVQDDDFVLTQEPVDLESFIKQRINEDDVGAGVFGALTHLELPEYGGKRKKTADDFFTEIDFEEEDVDEPPKYMIDRTVLEHELEEEFKTTPFESYNLTRGQTNHPVLGNTLKVVGRFKGLVRVMLNEDEPPLFDLDQLLKPQGYKIRLYVLRGTNLTPMDVGFGGRPGKSDPYLKVKLGKEKFNDRENAVDDVTDVDFYKMIEFNAELPGFSQLEISVMDHDDIGSDDVIGVTTIDLEDRWFDARWQEIGKENRVLPGGDDPTLIRWDTKFLERRSLYVPSSNNGQGIVECWVDILTPAEDSAFPPDDVALPPRQMFEMRIVIWKAQDVPAQDTLGGQNMTDLYIVVKPEGCKEQSTDTHWRAKKGKASFNWRMTFDMEFGHNTRAFKYPYLSFQMWDRDLLKYNDCFAEGAIDMGFYYRKAFKKNIAIKLYETPKGSAAKRVKKQNKESKQYEVEDTTADIPPPESKEDLPEEDQEEAGLLDSTLEEKAADSDDEDSDAGIGVLGGMKDEEKKRLAESTENSSKEVEGEPPKSFKEKLFGVFKRKQTDEEKEEEKKKKKGEYEEAAGEDADEEEGGEPVVKKDPDAEEQDALINNVKQMTGLWDIDPDDSTWIFMDKLDHETGIREPQGKICYGIQLWPKDKAQVMKVGNARTEPNQDPYLPPPTGRLQFSWNPFYMCMQICGPALCMKILCCVLCLGILALMIFCQPALNILIAIFLY